MLADLFFAVLAESRSQPPAEPRASLVQEDSEAEALAAQNAAAQELEALMRDHMGEVLGLRDARPLPVEELLASLERFRADARGWAGDAGSYLSYADYEVALALRPARLPQRALEVLRSSLEWRAAGVGTAPRDWLLFLETVKRRELMTELLREAGDRPGSFASLAALEELIDQAASGTFTERAPGAAEIERELSLRRFIALQLRADIELISGMPDLAARNIATLERSLEERWTDAELRGPVSLPEARVELFHVRQLRLQVLLGLARSYDVGPTLERWRAAGELQQLGTRERLRLMVLEAMATYELERIGQLELSASSPFEPLLEPDALAQLPSVERVRVLIFEASRLMEIGQLDAAEERFAEFQAQASPAELGNFHVERLTLGFELRRQNLALEQGMDLDPPAVQRLRARFKALLDSLSGGATQDMGATFLEYSSGVEILSELIELEQALAPGPEGVSRALEAALELQEVGGLAGRMRLESGGDGRVERLQALLGSAGSAGLLYAPGRHRSRVFWIEADEIESYPLGQMRTLERARSRMEGELTSFVALGTPAQRDRLLELVEELGELLLPAGLRTRLTAATSVALIAPGNLGYVPFELFEFEPGRRLGTAMAVTYWPSWQVAEHLAARPVEAEPRFDLGLLAKTELPGDSRGFSLGARDLKPLSRSFSGSRTAVVQGEDATQSWLLGQGASARAWLLVAHGERPSDSRDSSSLAVPGAGGEALLHSDSDFWKTPGLRVPELVWLGACSAWEGPFRRGDDGATHLPSRFLQHGATSVLLPFVELRYDDLVGLASRALAELVAGNGELTLGEALLRARVGALEAATDELGRIAPLLVHELGGPSPRVQFSGESPGPFGLDPRLFAGGALVGLFVGLFVAGGLHVQRRRRRASA